MSTPASIAGRHRSSPSAVPSSSMASTATIDNSSGATDVACTARRSRRPRPTPPGRPNAGRPNRALADPSRPTTTGPSRSIRGNGTTATGHEACWTTWRADRPEKALGGRPQPVATNHHEVGVTLRRGMRDRRIRRARLHQGVDVPGYVTQLVLEKLSDLRRDQVLYLAPAGGGWDRREAPRSAGTPRRGQHKDACQPSR